MTAIAIVILAALQASERKAVPLAPPRLEFRLSEADGRPLTVDWNRPLVRPSPGERALVCVRCPKGETPDPMHSTPECGDRRACTTFVVERGERYVYALFGADFDPVEGEVTIGDDALTVRELCVRPPAPRATLQLHLLRPDWTPIGHDTQVSLESLSTGLTLFRAELSPHDLQFERAYPAGRYRLRVDTEDSSIFWDCGEGLHNRTPPPFGAWVETIDLGADAPLAIESFFWRGGRLRLALDLPEGAPAIDPAWAKEHPSAWWPPEFHWLALGSRGPGAIVRLRPDPDAPAVVRERGMPDVSIAPLRFEFRGSFDLKQPALLPGDEQTSADWIPPGSYIARIEARGFVPVEAKFVIRRDETTSLRIRLKQR